MSKQTTVNDGLMEGRDYQYAPQKPGVADMAAILYILLEKMGGELSYTREFVNEVLQRKTLQSQELRLMVPVKKDPSTGNVKFNPDGQGVIEDRAPFKITFVEVEQDTSEEMRKVNPNIVVPASNEVN